MRIEYYTKGKTMEAKEIRSRTHKELSALYSEIEDLCKYAGILKRINWIVAAAMNNISDPHQNLIHVRETPSDARQRIDLELKELIKKVDFGEGKLNYYEGALSRVLLDACVNHISKIRDNVKSESDI